jgi:hypothetical protein
LVESRADALVARDVCGHLASCNNKLKTANKHKEHANLQLPKLFARATATTSVFQFSSFSVSLLLCLFSLVSYSVLLPVGVGTLDLRISLSSYCITAMFPSLLSLCLRVLIVSLGLSMNSKQKKLDV